MSRPDVVVIGGGPAGSASAIRLARGGARVVLLERTRAAHHKVCGEFISAAARQQLHELEIDHRLLDSVPVHKVRLLHDGKVAETALPFAASSLSRKLLDEALLRVAAESGVEIRRGVQASALSVGAECSVRLSDGGSVASAAIFLATGKHDLRGRARAAGIHDGLIGLKMHFDLAPAAIRALDGSVELLFFRGGYAGLQLVENRRANLCLLISKRQFEAEGRTWSALVENLAGASPAWRERLAGARPCWRRPLAIYNLPYGYVAGAEAGPVFRLGDQLAVVPSFAGDGMAIALTSARAAADAWLSGNADAVGYHAAMAQQLGPRIRASAWGSRLLEQPLVQSAAVRIASRAPGLLARIAAATRIGGRVLSAT